MIKKAIDAIREAEEQAGVLCRVAAERADEMRAEVESEGTAHYNKITEDAQRECDFELSVITAKTQRLTAKKKKELAAETEALAAEARNHMEAAVGLIVWGIVEKCQ